MMVLYLHSSFSIEAKKIGVVSQTTLDQETFCDVVRMLAGMAERATRSTTPSARAHRLRRREAIELARAG